MRKHPLRLVTAVAAALALVMTGCSSGGDSGEPDTLKVWWWETDDSALSAAWKQAVSIFEKEHPGVTVKQELKTYEQMQQSGQLILDSNDTPDVLEYLKGNATAGVVAKAGLLTDLTEVATARGWKLDNSAQDVGLYDDNGLMGSGKRYGITNYGEYVGVWYNQDLFAQNNVQVPTTLAEFENALKTFADKGVTPLALGSADYPGTHLLYSLALSHMDDKSLAAYQRFEGDVDWSAWDEAATTMRQWVDKKYISTDSTGIPAQDAGNAFIAGQYPMFVSGTWWAGQIAEQRRSLAVVVERRRSWLHPVWLQVVGTPEEITSPSAERTSLSTWIVRSPRCERSMAARSERPMRRWISWLRPETRRAIRSGLEPGSMAYSAVTQPSSEPLRHRGTPVEADAAQLDTPDLAWYEICSTWLPVNAWPGA